MNIRTLTCQRLREVQGHVVEIAVEPTRLSMDVANRRHSVADAPLLFQRDGVLPLLTPVALAFVQRQIAKADDARMVLGHGYPEFVENAAIVTCEGELFRALPELEAVLDDSLEPFELAGKVKERCRTNAHVV